MANGNGFEGCCGTGAASRADDDDGTPCTEAQIRKIYAVLHSLGLDPREFKKQRGFTNYAQLTKRQASDLIEELERAEVENNASLILKRNNAPSNDNNAPNNALVNPIDATEFRMAVNLMEMCVAEARRIVERQMDFVLSEQVQARSITSIAATLFIQLMRRGGDDEWKRFARNGGICAENHSFGDITASSC